MRMGSRLHPCIFKAPLCCGCVLSCLSVCWCQVLVSELAVLNGKWTGCSRGGSRPGGMDLVVVVMDVVRRAEGLTQR